jgi:membrane protein
VAVFQLSVYPGEHDESLRDTMLQTVWTLIKTTVSGFIEHDALSRGAAIAYFTLFSLAPLLIIVIAIASLVFGYEAAQQAIVGQFSGLMGAQTADALQSMVQGASLQRSGTLATVIGVATLLITATGAFGEIQSTLNLNCVQFGNRSLMSSGPGELWGWQSA